MSDNSYLPISSYAAIGNTRTAALVGLDGCIDWCCFPDLDSPSVFAAILDARKGGRWRVALSGVRLGTQRYIPETNVLETRFEHDDATVIVTDFMPLEGSLVGVTSDPVDAAIYRLVKCERASATIEIDWSPRFDYARARTEIRQLAAGVFLASAGGESLVLNGVGGDVTITHDDYGPTLRARIDLAPGEQRALVMRYSDGAAVESHDDALHLLEETVEAWRAWVHTDERADYDLFTGKWRDHIVRSSLVLKLLTHRHTGAMAAALTTSLPEHIGGVRNWDYRYTWLRDSAFTAQALFAVEHRTEALDFLSFVERVSASKTREGFALQIMYGLHGETELQEMTLDHLEGYRGSRPVRIGNAAAKQRQLDVYGELVNAAYELVRFGGSIEPDLWSFLTAVVDAACDVWREPGEGIWEIRGAPRHYTFGKVMAWVAMDRAIRLAEQYSLEAPIERWRHTRSAVRECILTEGYDASVGAFVQSFGSTELDASNLLIPIVEFLPFDDPRVQGTLDRTLERLTHNGVVYRYLNEDGLPGSEGAFGLCTFWLISALALAGRRDEALELFEGMLSRANHVGLYAEEFDPRTNEFLGNFPQAFSHIGLINSALYLAHAERPVPDKPAPVGSAAHRVETGHDSGGAQ